MLVKIERDVSKKQATFSKVIPEKRPFPRNITIYGLMDKNVSFQMISKEMLYQQILIWTKICRDKKRFFRNDLKIDMLIFSDIWTNPVFKSDLK